LSGNVYIDEATMLNPIDLAMIVKEPVQLICYGDEL
jgi:hypothetical protein